MKIVSIDIETTSLDPETGQILEIGAVVDNLVERKPLDTLPKFHCYLIHDEIHGDPVAIAMNKVAIDRISKRTPPYLYIRPDQLAWCFADFLTKNGVYDNTVEKANVAGKNFSNFDFLFLQNLPNFTKLVRFHHRVLDPSILYWQKGDIVLPNSKTCMERAGLKGDVAHTAMEDAIMVVELLRKKV